MCLVYSRLRITKCWIRLACGFDRKARSWSYIGHGLKIYSFFNVLLMNGMVYLIILENQMVLKLLKRMFFFCIVPPSCFMLENCRYTLELIAHQFSLSEIQCFNVFY